MELPKRKLRPGRADVRCAVCARRHPDQAAPTLAVVIGDGVVVWARHGRRDAAAVYAAGREFVGREHPDARPVITEVDPSRACWRYARGDGLELRCRRCRAVVRTSQRRLLAQADAQPGRAVYL